MASNIQWGRVAAGAVLLEVALIVLFIPLFAWIGQSEVVPFVPIGVFVLGFLFGWWVGRKVRSRSVLHGVLVGILATALYIVLCIPAPGGIGAVIAMYGLVPFVVGNGLRIVACAAGAFASRASRA